MKTTINPVRFVYLARVYVKKYCEEQRSSYEEGCHALTAVVKRQWEECIRSSFDESQKSVLQRMVTIQRRQNIVKEPRQALAKLLSATAKISKNTRTKDKSNASLVKHAIEQQDYDIFRKAFPHCVTDLSGLEVTLPYVFLVRDFVERFKREETSQFQDMKSSDYLSNPQQSGYRALHLHLSFKGLPYELQVKSYLQAAWGKYTHDLAYKHVDTLQPGPGVQREFRNLSELLAVADSIAEAIFRANVKDRNEKRQQC